MFTVLQNGDVGVGTLTPKHLFEVSTTNASQENTTSIITSGDDASHVNDLFSIQLFRVGTQGAGGGILFDPTSAFWSRGDLHFLTKESADANSNDVGLRNSKMQIDSEGSVHVGLTQGSLLAAGDLNVRNHLEVTNDILLSGSVTNITERGSNFAIQRTNSGATRYEFYTNLRRS